MHAAAIEWITLIAALQKQIGQHFGEIRRGSLSGKNRTKRSWGADGGRSWVLRAAVGTRKGE